jgi:hypothetical protein
MTRPFALPSHAFRILAPTTIAIAIVGMLGCTPSCPNGTTLEKSADLCVGLPSGFLRTSQNGGDGQEAFAYGPKGRMVMFVHRQTLEESAQTRQKLAARAATPPPTLTIVESGATEAFAYQLYQYKGRPTFEVEAVFADAAHGGQTGRCTATFASESEAKEILSACRKTRFLK